MKKLLITGGAGFIGSHLCERLLDAGMRRQSLHAELDRRVDELFENSSSGILGSLVYGGGYERILAKTQQIPL